MKRPPILVVVAWLGLAAWIVCNRGLHPNARTSAARHLDLASRLASP